LNELNPKDLRKECVKRLNEKGYKITLDELNKMMAPIEKVYAIVDHTRTLAYMLTDGIVPSNTKAGYLARLVIRRTLRFLDSLKLDYSLSDLVLRQIKAFENILNTELNDIIIEMLDLETKRYYSGVKKLLDEVYSAPYIKKCRRHPLRSLKGKDFINFRS